MKVMTSGICIISCQVLNVQLLFSRIYVKQKFYQECVSVMLFMLCTII